jgi:hypothetical protein
MLIVDQLTIAQPVLAPATPTVAGSAARERRPCGPSHPFPQVRIGRYPAYRPTPNRRLPSMLGGRPCQQNRPRRDASFSSHRPPGDTPLRPDLASLDGRPTAHPAAAPRQRDQRRGADLLRRRHVSLDRRRSQRHPTGSGTDGSISTVPRHPQTAPVYRILVQRNRVVAKHRSRICSAVGSMGRC